ncbi:formate dehydrogenase accessory protein FdhE [Geomesophilobacter sediminis]|uniref:Protein FdhE homolog n=1 Tax=Geomesophilobacter sediminis TaxID=2798584 RepID=A0A8J7JDU6_9BACT|nr:formate dehydrogenase accessory protein FdhE [Geomesophilobacter sediminis]MBJ6723924.1 formate dehydrogenase accessory protein FdhE [Geomesophilobacter sediminis]
MNSGNNIKTPGELTPPSASIKPLLRPGRDIFAQRAARLRRLSRESSLGSYLAFLALLSDAQQHALDRFPPLPSRSIDPVFAPGGPPLAAASWGRDGAWRAGLTAILDELSQGGVPREVRDTVADLRASTENRLERLADQVLAGNLEGVAPGELPFIAAALQVYWVQMAVGLDEPDGNRLSPSGVCPVCGSPPVAGVVHASGSEQGLRYLCCSLCASQWHLVRLTCSACDATQGVDYYTLEGSDGAVKAEGCDSCGSYLKLFYLEKDGQMEPMADDLATLALDMLLEREGKASSGCNPFFHPGEVATTPI